MGKKYIFLSDLHIGGEGVFAKCDFKKELIQFLKSLKDSTTELILVGDSFGLWEVYSFQEEKKLEFIIKQHKDIFEQFKKTGERIKVTVIPGNHDHELAAYPKMKTMLRKYNITLVQKGHITRKIGKKLLWIEHGNQQDKYNYIADWKDKTSKPVGYYFNHTIIKQTVEPIKQIPWLRNVLAINSPKEIPNWFFSSYFYKEMHPVLRYVTTPILAFAFLAIFFALWYSFLFAGRFLEQLITGTSFFATDFSKFFGFAGRIWDLSVFASIGSVTVFILFSLPLLFVLSDVKKAFLQFGIKNRDEKQLGKEAKYDSYAKSVFTKHKNVIAFIYGHTHRASIRMIGKRAVINTGTWLKILRKRKPSIRLFPAIYEPSFKLNYITVQEEKKNISISYDTIKKTASKEMKILEQILPKQKDKTPVIPKKTIIPL